jgi:hypothetical protein
MEVISIIMVGIVIVGVTVFFMRPDKTTQLVGKAYKKHSRRIPTLLNLVFLVAPSITNWFISVPAIPPTIISLLSPA